VRGRPRCEAREAFSNATVISDSGSGSKVIIRRCASAVGTDVVTAVATALSVITAVVVTVIVVVADAAVAVTDDRGRPGRGERRQRNRFYSGLSKSGGKNESALAITAVLTVAAAATDVVLATATGTVDTLTPTCA
jgi:hypothetical protein